jgi:hypothetical protein
MVAIVKVAVGDGRGHAFGQGDCRDVERVADVQSGQVDLDELRDACRPGT